MSEKPLDDHAPAGLPPGETTIVEVELSAAEEAELARRRGEDELAPEGDEELARYLVDLGRGYLGAERLSGGKGSSAERYAALHRRSGQLGGRRAALHYRYAEAASAYAAEERARAAHDREAGVYERLAERIEEQLETRRRRIRNLEQRLHADRASRR